VIAHEYFHNWSGNRVTCRDWFQLSLKEGFTVLRDQLFSAGHGQRGGQADRGRAGAARGPVPRGFGAAGASDPAGFLSGDLQLLHRDRLQQGRRGDPHDAHLAGPERFRKGTDLYFERHDGEAATCEDFIKAIEDGAGLDLAQFRLWYVRPARPRSPRSCCTRAIRRRHAALEQEVPPPPASRSSSRCRSRCDWRCSTARPGKHHGEN
jgi:aminopeptidase N